MNAVSLLNLQLLMSIPIARFFHEKKGPEHPKVPEHPKGPEQPKGQNPFLHRTEIPEIFPKKRFTFHTFVPHNEISTGTKGSKPMAKIRLEFYLEEINGRIGNIVYYHCRGREYARVHVTPSNPRTQCQQAVRGLFALAVLSWQQLAPAEKAEFNRRARYKPMSGYNLYISQFMK